MPWLLPFILGWWGSHWFRNWWPGIEYDAPKPGGGDPWMGLIIGIASGVVAVIVTPMFGASEPMPGVFAAVATGAVTAHIVGALFGGLRKKG